MELVRKETAYASDLDDESENTPFNTDLTPRIHESPQSGLTFSRGRIRSLHLFNFKSYRGLVKVGPFTKFCAIVGHNGSGKSNLLDAIAFALCIKSPNFKGSLSDVISKCDEELPNAYVEIHLTDSPEAIFRRNVTCKNVVTYYVNDKPVTMKQYTEELFNYRIDMLGNSSLIFQGAIGNIAQRNPSDMTKLFDSVSGSYLLDSQYKNLKSHIDKLEISYHDMCVKKNHLEKHARRYRKMSDNESEFKKLMTKQDQLLSQKYQWEIKKIDENINSVKSSIDSKKIEIEGLINVMKMRRNEIDSLEDKRIEREREFSKSQEMKLEMKRKKMSMKLQIERIKSDKISLERAKNDATSRLQDTKSSIETANNSINSLKDEQTNLNNKLEALENESISDEFANISKKIDWELYRNIESHLSTELGEEKMILRTLKHKLQSDCKVLKSSTNSLQVEQRRLKEFTEKSSKLEQLYNDLKLRVTKIECDMTTCSKTLDITNTKIEKLKSAINAKQSDLSEARNISSLSDLYRDELFINNERHQLVRRMMASVPGVCGLLSTLFQIESEKSIVLKALSSKLNTIIVVDYDTSLRCVDCIKSCKRSYCGYLELISLDRLTLNSRWKDIRNKKDQRYLIDCISYEDRYIPLFEHLLGNYVIVKDIKSAYSNDNQHNGLVYITERGEIIRGKTITFDVGISDRLMKEFDISNFSARNDRVKQLELELGELENSLFQAEMDSTNLSNSIDKLKWEHKIATSKLEVCKKPVNYNNQEIVIINQSIKSWTDRVESLNKSIEELEKEIEDVNKRVELVECEVFKPLSESLGVDNIAILHRENLDKIHKRSTEIDLIKARLIQIPNEINDLELELEKLTTKMNLIDEEIDKIDSDIKNNESNLGELDLNTIDLDETSDSDDSDDNETLLNQSLLKLQQDDFEDVKNMEELKMSLSNLEETLEGLVSNRSNLMIKIKTEVGENFSNSSYDLVIEPNTRELDRVQRRLDELSGYGDYSYELSQVESNLNDLKIEINKTKTEIDDTKENFYNLRQKRKRIFMDFLTQVNRAIPSILNVLFDIDNSLYDCYNDNILYINNTIEHSIDEEPFYCPIFYNFSPNCYNIDVSSYSGGEKSLAGLGLILAFQKVKKTPFVVLDEIDAYVDSYFIKGILNYFNNSDEQIIAISLRDKLFSQADGLIGVFKSRSTGMSKTVSLNLSKYKSDEVCIEDGN